MKIESAKAEHAPLIAKAILMAIGPEITLDLAGKNHTTRDVENLFALLAAREDTQYSYRNTLTAIDDEGEVMGVTVCYDGEGLKRMRRIFFAEAARCIGLDPGADVDLLPEETTPDEFYLDTLAVWEKYRGKGVATALIKAARQKADEAGKPLGLLVDKTNSRARRLYESLGFRKVDEREFAGELMDHLLLIGAESEANVS